MVLVCVSCMHDRCRKSCGRSEEHTSELQSRENLVCRLLLWLPSRTSLLSYTTLFRSRGGRGGAGRFDALSTHPVPQCWRQAAAQCLARVCAAYGGRWRPFKWCSSASVACTTAAGRAVGDRKSTRLNSSHVKISYAVFCFGYHRGRVSFPTRRSSDLGVAEAELEDLTRSALTLCHNAGAKLLLNASPEFVLRMGADGVHLNGARLRQLHARPLPEELW